MAGKGREQGNSKTPYEMKRDDNIRNNNALLKKLKLRITPIPGESPSPPQEMNNLPSIHRKGAFFNMEDIADPNYVMENDEIDSENDDDDVGDGTNEQDEVCYEHMEDTQAQKTKGRNVRGPTKMKSVIASQGKLKKYVMINGYGQPCGIKTCNFTNFIAVLVKGGDMSLKHKDWRMVPTDDKEKIWTLVNKYFTIDPICKQWVMASAAKKWRDFKNTLKKTYFDENLSKEENIENGCNSRIPGPEWAWLVDHWSKEDTKSRAQRNKEVRQNQVNALHTCGSKSFAVVSHQLERELGRAPSRAEMYVVTRTKANGEALNEDCQQKIDVIRERIDNDESLVTKSIDDGDLYAELFPKEQKGRIRGLGLLPGGSKSIALARATAALKQMEFENEDLRERMENAERRCEISEQNYIELKNMLLAMQGANSPGVGSTGANNGAESGGANDCARSSGADPNSPVDVALDTIAQPMNVEERITSICARNGSQSFDNGKRSRANGQKEGKHNHNNVMGPTDLPIDNIAQSTVANKGTTSVCAKNGGQPIDNGKSFVANGHKEGTISRKSVLGRTTTNSLQLQSSSSDNGIIARGLDQTKIRKLGQNQDGDGKEVALRSLTGPMIVAYGRLKCTNKKAKGVDGQPLGEFYEVIVDVVLDRNVLLPRVHGQTTKLGAAIGRCIAWPFQNVVQKDGSALNMSKRAIDFR